MVSGGYQIEALLSATLLRESRVFHCGSTCTRTPGKSAPEGIRTPNLLIRSQMLYPLSYARLLSCVLQIRIVQAFQPTEKR